MEPITGIVLAGGQSRRMGQNKALLPAPGRERITFVEHLAALLLPLCAETLLVTRDQAAAADYAMLQGTRIVTDLIPGGGPLMGLYSGLRATSTGHAIVLAVDMPFVQPAMLSYLLALPRQESIIVPVVNGVSQVLFAIYPRGILPIIEARLREGRRDPRSLLDVAPVEYLDEARLRQVEPTLRSFVGVNTPEELRDAKNEAG
jgi:molybdopterin-guanine dinucleotide biosynthesis protein A